MPDHESMVSAVRQLLIALGEDPDRDGLTGTPERVARMYAELFSGIDADPDEVLNKTFDQPFDEMVLVRNISVQSMCEHHLMPFVGHASVAYIPGQRIVGLSKIARVVRVLSQRPQVQERLTNQVADSIERVLQPRGVAVRIECSHMCMSMRGIKDPGSTMVTTVTRGLFRSNPATRAEFLASATTPSERGA
jgi:GTP cyclohydrolase I